MTNNLLGSRIKLLRLNYGLTQVQVAEKLFMDRANISHYERGVAVPPSETLGKISRLFGVTTDYLLGREDGETVLEQTLEQRVSALEKEIAELKGQVSERLSVEELAKELELYRSKASHKTE